MMFFIFSLVLTLLSAWLLSTGKRLWVLNFAFLWLVNTLLLGVFVVADLLTDNGIDDSVAYHIMMGLSGAGFSQFAPEILTALIWTTLSLAVVIWLLRRRTPERSVYPPVLTLLLAIGCNPALHSIANLGNQMSYEPPPGYVSNVALSTVDPKSFVFLYLESVERTYFDEELFPGLVPSLAALEKDSLTFTNIHQAEATGWTIAGMVASQCGVPLVTSGAGNSMAGMESFLPKATCLGDLLSAGGYRLHYLGGADTRFGGKGQFYQTHGFESVQGLADLSPALEDPGYLSNWGLYDDTLLEVAARRLQELDEKPEPFGLFLLTLDTHHPKGYLSAACGGEVYGEGDNPILNAVHCTDKLIGRFVRQMLEQHPDTLVVIASDHLALPNSATDLLNQGARRNLFMVLGSDREPAQVNTPGTMLDVAPTMLTFLDGDVSSLGLGENLFGSDGRTLEETNQLIANHRGFFTQLWSFPDLSEGLTVNLDEFRLTLNRDQVIAFPALVQFDQNLNVSDVTFQAFSANTLLYKVRGFTPEQGFLWVDSCSEMNWLWAEPKSGQWCLAYGSLQDEHVAGWVLGNDVSLTAQEIEFQLSQPRSLSVMLERLGTLQKLIEDRAVPAH